MLYVPSHVPSEDLSFRVKDTWILANIPAVGEVGGYGARIASHYNNQAWGPYITQGVLTLIGPLWFAATIYMMLGRTIVLAGGEDVSLIKPRWYTRVFVTADVTTLFIQGLGMYKEKLHPGRKEGFLLTVRLGSSIMGTMQLKLAIAGEKIVIAGLALQVATFVVFLVASVDFQVRMNRKQYAASAFSASKERLPAWRKTLYILYSVSALILFRCTFRLVEYSMGNAAYLMAHEWALYSFDSVPMFLVLVLLAVLRPSQYVQQDLGKAEVESDSETGRLESK